jgi:superfamily II DNA/RNA helicase
MFQRAFVRPFRPCPRRYAAVTHTHTILSNTVVNAFATPTSNLCSSVLGDARVTSRTNGGMASVASGGADVSVAAVEEDDDTLLRAYSHTGPPNMSYSAGRTSRHLLSVRSCGEALLTQQSRAALSGLMSSSRTMCTKATLPAEPTTTPAETNLSIDVALTSKLISPSMHARLRAADFTSLFPVQTQTLKHTRAGNDVVVRSRTGSGKTMAFVIPIVDHIINSVSSSRTATRPGRGPCAIVLTPTRELAKQIHEQFERIDDLGKDTASSQFGDRRRQSGGRSFGDSGFRAACVYGGMPYNTQIAALKQGVDVVVGTPGRIIDMLEKGVLNLSQCRYVVLDEADEMLRMGFKEDVEQIMEYLPASGTAAAAKKTGVAGIEASVSVADSDSEGNVLSAGSNGAVTGYQLMMWSATMPPWVRTLAKKYSRAKDSLVYVDLIGEDNAASTTRLPSTIQFYAHAVDPQAGETGRNDAMVQLLQNFLTSVSSSQTPARALVFTDTKAEASELAGLRVVLNNASNDDHRSASTGSSRPGKRQAYASMAALTGDLSQAQRERALDDFRAGKVQVLCATDVAARGLDIPEVEYVIHYRLPESSEAFVHRSGRTGRAGKSGEVHTLIWGVNDSVTDTFTRRSRVDTREFQQMAELEKELNFAFTLSSPAAPKTSRSSVQAGADVAGANANTAPAAAAPMSRRTVERGLAKASTDVQAIQRVGKLVHSLMHAPRSTAGEVAADGKQSPSTTAAFLRQQLQRLPGLTNILSEHDSTTDTSAATDYYRRLAETSLALLCTVASDFDVEGNKVRSHLCSSSGGSGDASAVVSSHSLMTGERNWTTVIIDPRRFDAAALAAQGGKLPAGIVSTSPLSHVYANSDVSTNPAAALHALEVLVATAYQQKLVLSGSTEANSAAAYTPVRSIFSRPFATQEGVVVDISTEYLALVQQQCQHMGNEGVSAVTVTHHLPAAVKQSWMAKLLSKRSGLGSGRDSEQRGFGGSNRRRSYGGDRDRRGGGGRGESGGWDRDRSRSRSSSSFDGDRAGSGGRFESRPSRGGQGRGSTDSPAYHRDASSEAGDSSRRRSWSAPRDFESSAEGASGSSRPRSSFGGRRDRDGGSGERSFDRRGSGSGYSREREGGSERAFGGAERRTERRSSSPAASRSFDL